MLMNAFRSFLRLKTLITLVAGLGKTFMVFFLLMFSSFHVVCEKPTVMVDMKRRKNIVFFIEIKITRTGNVNS